MAKTFVYDKALALKSSEGKNIKSGTLFWTTKK